MTDQNEKQWGRLRANFGAHFLCINDTNDIDHAVAELRRALGSHPAITRLDTRNLRLSHVGLGVRRVGYGMVNPAEVLQAVNDSRRVVRLEVPCRFTIDTKRLRDSYYSWYPPIVDVVWDGAVFLAFWRDVDEPRYRVGGVCARELLKDLFADGGPDAFTQPPTVASTDLLIYPHDAMRARLMVEDADRGRAIARLALPPDVVEADAGYEAFKVLRPAMHAFYRLANLTTALRIVDSAAQVVSRASLTAEYEQAVASRWRMIKRARLSVRTGRVMQQSMSTLYLLAADCQRVLPALQEAIVEYRVLMESIGAELFGRDLRQIETSASRTDPGDWLRTADRLSERRGTRYIGVATMASAVVGGAVGATLTQLLT